ncbi:uncharacterized protein BXZ73DRAFT_82499 [Epithele typhae]|uniref:uncharacterized protein n=1 Tax=Epithele typhae TaxID=378194 RepID=UPI00200881D6|nr:uncharacterized protein BXZ73DRAFT_82499 [Epithele typhae]KAH9912107.1 hypothetical protein BXZ73DRAFT_82499 [Epithele typhae]
MPAPSTLRGRIIPKLRCDQCQAAEGRCFWDCDDPETPPHMCRGCSDNPQRMGCTYNFVSTSGAVLFGSSDPMDAVAFLGPDGFHIRSGPYTEEHRCAEAMIEWFCSHTTIHEFEIFASATNDFRPFLPVALVPFRRYAADLVSSRALLADRLRQWVLTSGLNPPVEPTLLIWEPPTLRILPMLRQNDLRQEDRDGWRASGKCALADHTMSISSQHIQVDVTGLADFRAHNIAHPIDCLGPNDANEEQLTKLNNNRREFEALSTRDDLPLAWVLRRQIDIVNEEEVMTDVPFLVYPHNANPTALYQFSDALRSETTAISFQGLGHLAHDLLYRAFDEGSDENTEGHASSQRWLLLYHCTNESGFEPHLARHCVAYLAHAIQQFT